MANPKTKSELFDAVAASTAGRVGKAVCELEMGLWPAGELLANADTSLTDDLQTYIDKARTALNQLSSACNRAENDYRNNLCRDGLA